jgi:cell division protein FtsZ
VLRSGVSCITDLMVKEGLINLDFADVRAVMREMGKAMMGTGESSGEKRALTAAEAAIANPLIDDASMKGAKGLLISITGGKDLTLYEVDEAATRIREEVDADANIIVGATFDESLEGIIRVSVVATGIDHAAIRIGQPSQAEHALKELAGKIRNDAKRATDKIERAKPPTQAPAAKIAAPAQAAAVATTEAEPASTIPAAMQSASAAAGATIESAAHAAVAAAILPPVSDNVSIRPMPVKPSLFEPPPQQPPIEAPMPKAFIPPAPERAAPPRPPRMPRIDELPLPAQNELRAQRGELAPDHPEKRRISLMQRLASVGLGRKSEENVPVPRTAQTMPPMPNTAYEQPTQRASARQPEGRPVSDYARRSAPQGLDPLGRPAPVHNSGDDDQLDIPAFLRRQAN